MGKLDSSARALAIGVAGTLLAVGLTGCTPLTQPDGSGLTGAPTASATQPSLGSRLLWADGSVVTVNDRKIDLAHVAAAGKDYSRSFSTEGLKKAKRVFTTLGMDSSGALVGVAGTRLSKDEILETGEIIESGSMRMGTYTPDSFVPFTRAGTPPADYVPQAITGATVTDDGIAWGELTWDNKGSMGWTVLGVSPGSTEARVLASWTPKQDPGLELTFETALTPKLVDGRVYWHVGYQTPTGESLTYQMLSVDFENPADPREEAAQTQTPTPWRQGVLAANLKPNGDGYAVPQAVSAYVQGSEPQEILRLEKLQSDGRGLQLLGSDERGLSVSYDGDLFIIDPETRNTEMFRGPYQSEVVGLAQCGSKVSWSFRQFSGEPPKERYVFDRDTSSLQMLHGSTMLGPGHCAGDFISWSEIDQPGDAGDPVPWDVVTRWKN